MLHPPVPMSANGDANQTILATSLSYLLVFLLHMGALDNESFTSPIGGPNKKFLQKGKRTEQFGATCQSPINWALLNGNINRVKKRL